MPDPPPGVAVYCHHRAGHVGLRVLSAPLIIGRPPGPPVPGTGQFVRFPEPDNELRSYMGLLINQARKFDSGRRAWIRRWRRAWPPQLLCGGARRSVLCLHPARDELAPLRSRSQLAVRRGIGAFGSATGTRSPGPAVNGNTNDVSCLSGS